jgi:hypothetical protein
MAYNAMLGKLNSNALGKAVAKSDMAKPAADKGLNFKELLTKMESGAEFAEMLGVGNNDINPTAQMRTLDGDGVAFAPGQEATEVGKPDASEKVLDMLGEVNKGHMQMDSLVNHILYSGKRFSNQELLVIQAHVFHYAQMTELTVKVAEQGVSSTKAILNTQVQ